MTVPYASLRDTVRDEAAFGLVLLIAAVGLLFAVVASHHWLRGVLIIAAALIVGGLARAVLTDRRAGLLAVRSRMFDVACYLVLGGTTIGFGVTAAALMGPG